MYKVSVAHCQQTLTTFLIGVYSSTIRCTCVNIITKSIDVSLRTCHLYNAVTYEAARSLTFLIAAYIMSLVAIACVNLITSLTVVCQSVLRQLHDSVLVVGDVGVQCPLEIACAQQCALEVKLNTSIAILSVVVCNGREAGCSWQRQSRILVHCQTVVVGEAEVETVVEETKIKTNFSCTCLLPLQVRVRQRAYAVAIYAVILVGAVFSLQGIVAKI